MISHHFVKNYKSFRYLYQICGFRSIFTGVASARPAARQRRNRGRWLVPGGLRSRQADRRGSGGRARFLPSHGSTRSAPGKKNGRENNASRAKRSPCSKRRIPFFDERIGRDPRYWEDRTGVPKAGGIPTPRRESTSPSRSARRPRKPHRSPSASGSVDWFPSRSSCAA